MTLPETESLELWPLSECWCTAAIDGSEAVAVAGVTEVVFPNPEPLDAASSVDDMSSSAPFRLSKDRAEDLVRRCELRARASVDVNNTSNQNQSRIGVRATTILGATGAAVCLVEQRRCGSGLPTSPPRRAWFDGPQSRNPQLLSREANIGGARVWRGTVGCRYFKNKERMECW